MRIRAGSIILSSVMALVAFVAPARAWQTNFDLLRDTTRAVAFDANGDIVAVNELAFSPSSGIFSVVKLSGSDGAPIWQTSITALGGVTGQGTALAIDPVGGMDPFGLIAVAGSVINTSGNEDFTVAKLFPLDGMVVFNQAIDGPPAGGDDRALAMALDGIDVVAGGYTNSRNILVVKLDGFSGAELWRWPLVGTQGEVEAVATNAATSMAVAVGSARNIGSGTDLLVVALDLATGTELWQRQVSGSYLRDDTAHAVAIDASDGSVVVAGVVRDSSTSNDFFVIKYDAAGTEMWRRAEDGTHGTSDVAYAVAIDPSGDVVAGGALDNLSTREDLAVFKYAGATGAVLWQRQAMGTRPGNDRANALRVDAAGGVVAAGVVRNRTDELMVIKWAADGAPVWRREINGDDNSSDAALSLDLRGSEVAVGGSTRNTATRDDATVIELSSVDGSGLEYHVASGKRLTLRDKQSDPTKRKVLLVSDTDIDFAAGDLADPTFTGATIELLNPTTGETDSYFLPPTQWLFRSGGPFKPDRYTYTDLDHTNGPCKRVILRRSRNLRAICDGPQIAFTLDEATQGSVEVRLHLGTDPFPYCMAFGGTVLRDDPTSGTHTGYFKSVNAKAHRCPVP